MILVTIGALSGICMSGEGANKYSYVDGNTSIAQLLNHPAFTGFGHHLLTREGDATRNIALADIRSLLPYHSNVNTDTVVAAVNHMIDGAAQGETIFYSIYSEQQKQEDRSKEATGLFFIRGCKGAPFAIVCPGGGFSYVGSVHEGFPYAMELSKKGYNAFVLRYRVGGGGTSATMDLAAALSFIFAHSEKLDVDTRRYSLWGSSAGARMVAYIGSLGTSQFGAEALPPPSAIVMAYTGHSDFTMNDPPTFAVVGENDGIASPGIMERRIANMRNAGIDSELHIFRNVGHGFGLGVGTSAEGWIDAAIKFWEKHM